MLPIYILALLIHAAYSTTPCQDGVKITAPETKNPQDLIGNWTNVYHWDNMTEFQRKSTSRLVIPTLERQCPVISIEAITPEFLAAKEAECGDHRMPFNWADAKLKLDAPLMEVKGGVLAIGEKENWIMTDCRRMVRVVMKKVSEDYVVLINPEITRSAEMIAKRIPTTENLKCLTHNIDVGKGMSGFGLCD